MTQSLLNVIPSTIFHMDNIYALRGISATIGLMLETGNSRFAPAQAADLEGFQRHLDIAE